jgi:hypothetical protein
MPNNKEKTDNRVIALSVIVLVLTILIVTLLFTRKDDLLLAKKLCSNLMNANVLSEGECILSTSVPVLFEKSFPDGTPVDDVLAGMEGFRILNDISRSIKGCLDFRIITFQIKGSFLDTRNEYMELSFCHGKLVRQIYIE